MQREAPLHAWPSFWPKTLLAFAVSGAAALVLLSSSGGDASPPLRRLLVAGSFIAVATAVALYFGIRSNLGLPAKVAVYAISYNALVVGVKFVLAPRGLYEVNQQKELTTGFTPNQTEGALLIGGIVFVLYAAALAGLYQLAKWKLAGAPRWPGIPKLTAGHVLLGALMGAIAIAGGGTICIFIALIFLGSTIEYLDFVFTSGFSLLVALALAGATSLAALAFNSVADRARVLGDAALLMSFFWLALGFLALYHVLWVVYVLVLTSIWPLKVVVPK